jgi:hypothetical protein
VRILIAAALMLEGLSSGVSTMGRVPSLGIYGALTVVVLAARARGICRFAAG